ncbi:hypothetical protein Taro_005949 [Colocasia esculenta]|uniref:HhH-GPD domain-containing protein n=1 Tax=Colocasia esculenta TaxID=4460 RepID=A0A843TVR5_COLES|nr:hypothetical protein [Colocasia esculenta]
MNDRRQPSPPLPSSSVPASPKPIMSAPSSSSSPSQPPPPLPAQSRSPINAAQPAPPSAPPPSAADHNLASGPSSLPSSPPSPSLPGSTDPSPSDGSSTPASISNPNPSAALAAPTAAGSAGGGLSAGPAKIPSRPKKSRKLAAQAAAPLGDAKVEAAAAAEGGNSSGAIVAAGSAVAVEASSSRPRVVYRMLPRSLSADGEVAAAIHRLRGADPQLARVIEAHEPPVFQCLHLPFHSLARSILYQQLAFKAAASIYSRFLALCGGEAGVVPETVLSLTQHQLRQIGVSARKASYLHDLANKYRNGILSDTSIVAMDDKSLFTMLTMVKGIGAWSVHMFMIFSLHRPDVLPVGDLGVRKGVQLLYGLNTLPRPSQMEQLCERWKPYRSVGSWYMWRLVEAKGAPAALATVPSIGAALAAASGGGGGVCGPPLVTGVPQALPPLPLQHQPLQRQIQQQQHPHPPHQLPLQLPHPHSHQHQHHQHQHQQQLQMQTQLVDAIQSIQNLG